MIRLMCGVVVSSMVMFSVLVIMFSDCSFIVRICFVIFLVVLLELSRIVLLLLISVVVVVVICIFFV